MKRTKSPSKVPQEVFDSRIQIQALAEQFCHDGFTFKQLQRSGDVALFSKAKPDRPATFEVVIVQLLPAKTIFGKNYQAREAMPTSESWGTHGWSLMTLERAREKFGEVIAERRKGRFSSGRTVVGAFSGQDGVLTR